MRKPVFGVFDQVAHKPGCTATEDGFGFRKKKDCTIYVAKTKALISFAVTAKLICVFVFAYAKSRFSHDAAHIKVLVREYLLNAYTNNKDVQRPAHPCRLISDCAVCGIEITSLLFYLKFQDFSLS